MAPRAPKPGTTPNSPKAQASEESPIFKITYGSDVLELDMRDIGPMDEQVLEAQSGKTLRQILEDLDHSPNLAALIWLARRKRGERRLTYREVLKALPSAIERRGMFEAGTFDLDVITGGDEEGLDDDLGEGAESAPLPSAAD